MGDPTYISEDTMYETMKFNWEVQKLFLSNNRHIKV